MVLGICIDAKVACPNADLECLCLVDCFNPQISENDVLRDYISDYKINVFDIGAMTIEETALFKSDFREIAEHFVKVRTGRKYIPSDRTITHVDEFLKLMKILTGDNRYYEVSNVFKNSKGGRVSMCKILDEYENRGISQGISQGEELMSQLIIKLTELGRTSDLEKAAMDREYRKQLFEELGIA